MKNLEKLIALIITVSFGIYCLLAFRYPLLPFEESLIFKPNTFPIGVGILGFVLSFIYLVLPQKVTEEMDTSGMDDNTESEQQDNQDAPQKLDYKTTGILLLLMVFYAFLLRPLGFVVSTALLLFSGSFALGERKLITLGLISIGSAFLIWYLVDQLLGIYMNALPAWLMQ